MMSPSATSALCFCCKSGLITSFFRNKQSSIYLLLCRHLLLVYGIVPPGFPGCGALLMCCNIASCACSHLKRYITAGTEVFQ